MLSASAAWYSSRAFWRLVRLYWHAHVFACRSHGWTDIRHDRCARVLYTLTMSDAPFLSRHWLATVAIPHGAFFESCSWFFVTSYFFLTHDDITNAWRWCRTIFRQIIKLVLNSFSFPHDVRSCITQFFWPPWLFPFRYCYQQYSRHSTIRGGSSRYFDAVNWCRQLAFSSLYQVNFALCHCDPRHILRRRTAFISS